MRPRRATPPGSPASRCAAGRPDDDLGLGAIHDPARSRTARRARGRAQAQGIPTAIYYAKPLHRQAAYRHFPVADGGVPVSERLAEEVISLPMHAYLEEPVQDRIIAAVRRALAG